MPILKGAEFQDKPDYCFCKKEQHQLKVLKVAEIKWIYKLLKLPPFEWKNN